MEEPPLPRHDADGMTLTEGLAHEIYRVPARVGPEFLERAADRFGLTDHAGGKESP